MNELLLGGLLPLCVTSTVRKVLDALLLPLGRAAEPVPCLEVQCPRHLNYAGGFGLAVKAMPAKTGGGLDKLHCQCGQSPGPTQATISLT